MITEIIGAPAAGKSTITKLLAEATGKRVLNNIKLRHDREWKEGAMIWPTAWGLYIAQHATYQPDPTPEGDEKIRQIVLQKTKQRIEVYLSTYDDSEMFLWNKGILQVPIDAGMHSNIERLTPFYAILSLWPRPDIIVEVRVPQHIGWERYRARKLHRHRRARSRQYPGMTAEQYHQRHNKFNLLVDYIRDGAHIISLDNTEDVTKTDEWKALIKRLK